MQPPCREPSPPRQPLSPEPCPPLHPVDLPFLQRKGTDLGSSWELKAASTTQVLHWLNSSHPEAASLRAERDQQLAGVEEAAVAVVTSEEGAEVLWQYRPGAKVGSMRANWLCGGEREWGLH